MHMGQCRFTVGMQSCWYICMQYAFIIVKHMYKCRTLLVEVDKVVKEPHTYIPTWSYRNKPTGGVTHRHDVHIEQFVKLQP